MKTLSDRFVVDAESTRERTKHEQARKIECKFEQQCRQVEGVLIKQAPIKINPLAEKLKGLS